MKTCSDCGESKPMGDFPKAKTCIDGRRSYCSKCHTKKRRIARNNNPDQMEKTRLASLRWSEKNRSKSRQIKRKWMENNKETYKEIAKEYRKSNKNKINLQTSVRRKRHREATTYADKEFHDLFIKEIYELAQIKKSEFGFEWHVDHIIPLKHDKVCGLHCVDNLQLIPASINLKKSNSFEY